MTMIKKITLIFVVISSVMTFLYTLLVGVTIGAIIRIANLCAEGKYHFKDCLVEPNLHFLTLKVITVIPLGFVAISLLLVMRDYQTSHKK